MEPVEHAYLEPAEEERSEDDVGGDGDEVVQDASSSISGSLGSEYSSGYDSESEEGDDEADDSPEEEDDEEDDTQAPTFMVPSRTIAAVEHPFLIMNQASALESFGPTPQYNSVS